MQETVPPYHLSYANTQSSSPTGHVAVLSFAEGLPTPLAGFIPKVVIVPFESAYPGYGSVKLLPTRDHIDICKPMSRQDDIYQDVLRFIRESAGAAAAGGGSSSGQAATSSGASGGGGT